MNEKPNYYAIIPANVRYDNTLNANAKILYGEIAALCNKYGVCWATNSYFAKLYNTTIRSISRWLNELKESGYIKVEMAYDKNNLAIEKRKITILLDYNIPMDKNVNYGQNCREGIDENVMYPIDKNVQDNNTSNNITSINNTPYNPPKGKKEFEDKFEMFWNEYPRHDNKQKTIRWFEKNNPSNELLEIMLEKIRLLKQTNQWKNKQYIPMPTTWLNGKRWEDEVIIEEPPKPKSIYEEI